MNYRHIYHAGNFGDVLKHIVLIAILKSLQRKETPFCFFDTHAGIGIYNLHSNEAKKNAEAQRGIAALLQSENPPELISEYLKCVKSFNKENTLEIYPGSPAIAKYFLRPQDKMILCELHEEDAQTLKRNFRNDKQIAIHFKDGYQGLKAFLPPPEKRGLVLIDPSYEQHQEYDTILKSLTVALERFQQGIYAIWYPIKDAHSAERFVSRLRAKFPQPALNIQLTCFPTTNSQQLNGSGIFIINPPFKLDDILLKEIPWVWNQLDKKNLGQWKIN